MLNNIFGGIFESVAETTISVGDFMICILVSLLIGAFIAGVYAYRSNYTKSFVVTLMMLPATVCIVIMMVNGNVGAGVAVAGAFSLVRFRSVPGTAKEIGTIFLAMAALFTVLPVKNENLSVYLLFFALATICGARAYMNTSYGVLFAVYEGSVLSDHLVLCLLPAPVYGTGRLRKQKGIACMMLLLLLVLSYVLGGRESLLVSVAALLLLFLVKIFLFLADCVAADRKKPEKRGDA